MQPIQTENLISVDEFCLNNNVETSFISLLHQSGLIEIVIFENANFIESQQLVQLEKMVNFYYELNINIEGIETINHLLQQLDIMQREINTLKNKLVFYE